MVLLKLKQAAQIEYKSLSLISRQQDKEFSWVGAYQSDEKNPTLSGDYTITIKKLGETLIATVYAQGIQLYDNFECRAEESGNELKLYLIKNLDEQKVYAAGRPIKRGEFVGSLTVVRNRRGAAKFLYKPGAYVIAFGARRKMPPPAYFLKQK
ncbi:MAG: DUF5991 domain-containing protein [Pyrinomonadaceae bacterium]